MPRVFLTAEWRSLLMLNFRVDPAILQPRVPRGTELDLWQGETLVTLVGFRFLRTRVLGLQIPWHVDFEEVNLRFYVRRQVGDEWRRGVVFVKEIVPRRAIAGIARIFYNENYVSLPMQHTVPGAEGGALEYAWFAAGRWHRLSAMVEGEPGPFGAGSQEEFITEHYWGYSRSRAGTTIEYQVEHPRWRVWPATDARFEAEVGLVYGADFTNALRAAPVSAFVAEGSAVVVRAGVRITPQESKDEGRRPEGRRSKR